MSDDWTITDHADGPMTVDVTRYLSWRAWLRLRYRTRCRVCGERTSGHRALELGILAARRHLAWHAMLDAILRRAARDGIIPDGT